MDSIQQIITIYNICQKTCIKIQYNDNSKHVFSKKIKNIAYRTSDFGCRVYFYFLSDYNKKRRVYIWEKI